MAPPAIAEGGGGGVQQPQQRQGFGQSISGVIRMAVFWYFASKFFFSPKKTADPALLMNNLFQKGEPLEWICFFFLDIVVILVIRSDFNNYAI